MPRPQNNTSRQLVASLICATALQKQSKSPVAISNGFAVYRQSFVDRIASLIHQWTEEYKTAPPKDARAWRDAFCHLCDVNDAFLGTLTEHAARVFDAGWTVEGGLKGHDLVCPNCEEVSNAR